MGAMFHHLVLLRFTPGTDPERIRGVAARLAELPGTIRAIRSYDVQVDAGLGTDNAHLSVHATFDDQDDWRIYATHPDHLRVIEEHIAPILDTALRTQYVDETGTERS